jgi:hypothetical protein
MEQPIYFLPSTRLQVVPSNLSDIELPKWLPLGNCNASLICVSTGRSSVDNRYSFRNQVRAAQVAWPLQAAALCLATACNTGRTLMSWKVLSTSSLES